MTKLITWDWKDEAPLYNILLTAQRMLGQWFFTQPDTGGDYYAVIISDHQLTTKEIQDVLEDPE